MDFDELLDAYKASPRKESLVLLLNEPVLLKYCVIFKQVPIARIDDYPADRTWAELWKCVELDYEQIALLADDTLTQAKKNVTRIVGLRLVYPDGSVPQLVEKAMVKMITDKLS